MEEQTPIIHENVGDVIHDEIGKDEAIQSLTEAMENVRNKIKEKFDHDPTNCRKAIKTFAKKTSKHSSTNDSLIQKSLFTFS